ncbi:hypothetical protein B0H15DRAFT_943451 [Mycena belliarum]|uniref:Uncharacterized protein n=1 Tax=Mycena belliarum TaxID=1033014 RepID=A0AAD6UHJ9_9AGAR|nr:hypothetical protein B0H15DRAFT_943451 [Mycena belliae]
MPPSSLSSSYAPPPTRVAPVTNPDVAAAPRTSEAEADSLSLFSSVASATSNFQQLTCAAGSLRPRPARRPWQRAPLSSTAVTIRGAHRPPAHAHPVPSFPLTTLASRRVASRDSADSRTPSLLRVVVSAHLVSVSSPVPHLFGRRPGTKHAPQVLAARTAAALHIDNLLDTLITRICIFHPILQWRRSERMRAPRPLCPSPRGLRSRALVASGELGNAKSPPAQAATVSGRTEVSALTRKDAVW